MKPLCITILPVFSHFLWKVSKRMRYGLKYSGTRFLSWLKNKITNLGEAYALCDLKGNSTPTQHDGICCFDWFSYYFFTHKPKRYLHGKKYWLIQLKHWGTLPIPWYGQYLVIAHNLITPVEAACHPTLDQKLKFLLPKRDTEQPRHFHMRAPPWN